MIIHHLKHNQQDVSDKVVEDLSNVLSHQHKQLMMLTIFKQLFLIKIHQLHKNVKWKLKLINLIILNLFQVKIKQLVQMKLLSLNSKLMINIIIKLKILNHNKLMLMLLNLVLKELKKIIVLYLMMIKKQKSHQLQIKQVLNHLLMKMDKLYIMQKQKLQISIILEVHKLKLMIH